MLTQPEAVDFLLKNPTLVVARLEEEAGMPPGTLHETLRGAGPLTGAQLDALESVLRAHGLDEFRNRRARVVAVTNHKGGVGKTTTTLNLGRALALLHYRVLVVDLDAQGNLSQCLGVLEPARQLGDVLGTGDALPVVPVLENYDLVPSAIDLARMESELGRSPVGSQYLKASLRPLLGQYDFVFIDCPPALNIFTSSALIAADSVLVVMQPEISAYRGINSLLEIIDDTRTYLNAGLHIGGVVLSQVDKRLVVHREVIRSIRQELAPYQVLETEIRTNTALKESQLVQQDIFRYQPTSTGAADYQALAQEFLRRCV